MAPAQNIVRNDQAPWSEEAVLASGLGIGQNNRQVVRIAGLIGVQEDDVVGSGRAHLGQTSRRAGQLFILVTLFQPQVTEQECANGITAYSDPSAPRRVLVSHKRAPRFTNDALQRVGGRDHVRLSGIAYDNFDIIDAFLCEGVLGNLCQLGTIFEAGDEAVWPRGVGPEHGRVADVDTDFENYFSRNHPH